MTGTCDHCGTPVITTPDGQQLDAEPDLLGIVRPDGRQLTEAQARRAVCSGRPVGHHPHTCPKPTQGDLFGGAA
jgi:hypothetical protein